MLYLVVMITLRYLFDWQTYSKTHFHQLQAGTSIPYVLLYRLHYCRYEAEQRLTRFVGHACWPLFAFPLSHRRTV